MEEVEMVDVFIAGVRWSVPQPVYESILATQAELAGQTERENGYESRIAELEEENKELLEYRQYVYSEVRDSIIADVLAQPTVTLGPMGTKAIPIFRIEALRGEGIDGE